MVTTGSPGRNFRLKSPCGVSSPLEEANSESLGLGTQENPGQGQRVTKGHHT